MKLKKVVPPKPPGARRNLTVAAVAITVNLVLGYLGYPVAGFIFIAASIGYAIGAGKGFGDGLDAGRRIHLQIKLEELRQIEEQAVEELAVDHEVRRSIAATKAELVKEIASIR